MTFQTTLQLSSSGCYPCQCCISILPSLVGGGNASITIVSLIAMQCLVFLSPGPKGNNGVMGKILRALTLFGFRMFSTGLIEGLYGVCLCTCVSVLPGDMLKRDEFVAIHYLFLWDWTVNPWFSVAQRHVLLHPVFLCQLVTATLSSVPEGKWNKSITADRFIFWQKTIKSWVTLIHTDVSLSSSAPERKHVNA